MDVFCFRYNGARAALLAHAVQMMQWPHSFAQGMSIRNCSRDIDFGQKDGFRQSAPVRQVAG
jgi:hypothetical protein